MIAGASVLVFLSLVSLGIFDFGATYPLLLLVPGFLVASVVGKAGFWVVALLMPSLFLVWNSQLFQGEATVPLRIFVLLFITIALNSLYFLFFLVIWHRISRGVLYDRYGLVQRVCCCISLTFGFDRQETSVAHKALRIFARTVRMALYICVSYTWGVALVISNFATSATLFARRCRAFARAPQAAR